MAATTRSNNPTAAERAEVDVSKPAEVVGWCNKWGVIAEQLKAAVAEVGRSAPAVARALGKPD
jgi:Protein of unknown function (DUF3606)